MAFNILKTSKLKSMISFNRILLPTSKNLFCLKSGNWCTLNFNTYFRQYSSGILKNTSATLHNSEKINKFFPSFLCKINPLIKSAFLNFPYQQNIRPITAHHVFRPSPENTKENLRYKVHYPEDGEYTIKPLPMTRLGGRDPETGRLIFGKIGGGHKRKYRWVILDRCPPGSKDPLYERVLHVQYDPNRTARIALVGHDDKLRYIIATTSMKQGDLITSTRHLPRMTIRPKEGDAHPVGALPFGTVVSCIEKMPGAGATLRLAAGTSAIVSRKVAGKIILQMNARQAFALDPNCLVTVGQVSNPEHGNIPIGSAQRARWLGIRPSSGLWQRKDGRYGRKLKRPPPVKHFAPRKKPLSVIYLNIPGQGPSRKIVPATNRVT